MANSAVLTEKENGIAVVTINQPDSMNSLTDAVVKGLGEAAAELSDDPEVKVIILTGAGRAFCAGGDIKRFESGFDSVSALDYMEGIQAVIKMWVSMKKPVIAAVNGAAVGAGLSLLCMCDMAFASEKAKIGCAFINMALVPDCGVAYFLPRIVGQKKAMEMAMTGRNYTAEEAERMGLINGVCPADELMAKVKEMAEQLANGPAFALRMCKRMINQGLDMDLGGLLHLEAMTQAECLCSEDSAEAVAAFLEKRKPVFK